MELKKKKILILAANPKTTPQLRLDEEIREINEGLRRSNYRDRFVIYSVLKTGQRDLRRALKAALFSSEVFEKSPGFRLWA